MPLYGRRNVRYWRKAVIHSYEVAPHGGGASTPTGCYNYPNRAHIGPPSCHSPCRHKRRDRLGDLRNKAKKEAEAQKQAEQQKAADKMSRDTNSAMGELGNALSGN